MSTNQKLFFISVNQSKTVDLTAAPLARGLSPLASNSSGSSPPPPAPPPDDFRPLSFPIREPPPAAFFAAFINDISRVHSKRGGEEGFKPRGLLHHKKITYKGKYHDHNTYITYMMNPPPTTTPPNHPKTRQSSTRKPSSTNKYVSPFSFPPPA